MAPAPATALISGFSNMAHSGINIRPGKHPRERTQQPLSGTTADINALLMMGNQFMQPGLSSQTNQTEIKSSNRSDHRANHRDRPYGGRRNRSPDYRQHDNRGNSRYNDRNSGGHGGRRR